MGRNLDEIYQFVLEVSSLLLVVIGRQKVSWGLKRAAFGLLDF